MVFVIVENTYFAQISQTDINMWICVVSLADQVLNFSWYQSV